MPVPPPFGQALDEVRRRLGGRPAETPAHITLVPPTQVEPAARGDIADHLEAVTSGQAPFTVHLRGTGTFRPASPVVFIVVVVGISSCEMLAAGLRSGPLWSRATFPYHPHVTIAHDLPDDELDRAFDEQAGFEATFQVAAVTQYELRSPGWQAVRELVLRG